MRALMRPWLVIICCTVATSTGGAEALADPGSGPDAAHPRFELRLDRNHDLCARFQQIYNAELGDFDDRDFARHPNFPAMEDFSLPRSLLKRYRRVSEPDDVYRLLIDINNDGAREAVIRTVGLQAASQGYCIRDDMYVYSAEHPYTKTGSLDYLEFFAFWDDRKRRYLAFEDYLNFSSFPLWLVRARPEYLVPHRVSGVEITQGGFMRIGQGEDVRFDACSETRLFADGGKAYFVVNDLPRRPDGPRGAVLVEYQPDKTLHPLCYLERRGTETRE